MIDDWLVCPYCADIDSVDDSVRGVTFDVDFEHVEVSCGNCGSVERLYHGEGESVEAIQRGR